MTTPESKLLFWMSHKGIVRKAALSQAVAAVQPDLQERKTYVNTFRRRVLELGHVEPLDDAANEWQVLPPYLALSSTQSDDYQALLCGGRTPQFLEYIFNAAEDFGLAISIHSPEISGTPPLIKIIGAQSAFHELANKLNIACVDSAARRMIENALKVDWQHVRLQQSTSDATPMRGQYKRWNWSERQWQIDERSRETFGDQVGDLVRVEAGYGPKLHLVRYRHQWRRIMSETQAQFVSAKLQGIALAFYDEPENVLQLHVRPPYFIARPLCLCSGLPPKRNASQHGHISYDFKNVPPGIVRKWGQAYGVYFVTFDTEVSI